MAQDEGQRYAVVVGIDAYEDANIPDLEGAAQDAQDIHDLLVDPEIGGFPTENVWLLKDENATLQNVKKYLGDRLQDVVKSREDTVFIFFSGHGFGDFIITHDSKRDSLFATALGMNEVATIFTGSPSEKMVFVLDTCFSGQAGGRTLPGTGAVPPSQVDDRLGRIAAADGKMILTACGGDELALEDERRGVFTRCLVEGVRTGAADVDKDGIIDVTELQRYLQKEVPRDSDKNQHPVFKGVVVRPFPIFQVKAQPLPPREVPILAFLGTQGGVGKTMVVNRAADLLARTIPGSSILLVDMDLETRQTTLLRTNEGAFKCKTMHDYIKGRIEELDSALDVTASIGKSDPIALENPLKEEYRGDSRIYLLPAVGRGEDTFDTAKKIKPSELLRVVRSVIASAVERYDISYVLVDCEARLNLPYTAVAAHVADRLFLLGRDEAATWDGHTRYQAGIDTFYPDFAPEKVHIVVNMVRAGQDSASGPVFAVIPNVAEIGNPFVDRLNVLVMRDVLLDRYVFDVLKRALGLRADAVRPKEILASQWRRLIEVAPQLADRPLVKVYRRVTRFWPLGLVVIAISTVLTLGLAGLFWLRYKRRWAAVRGLIEDKEDWVFKTLLTQAGRDTLEDLSRWSSKLTPRG